MITGIGNTTGCTSHLGYEELATGRSGPCSDSGDRVGSEKPPRSPGDDQNLSEEKNRQVRQLKKRDQEVRAHESAHMAAGADLVQGGASFSFQRGADGRMYAVGGEVKIDTSAERDPDDTIRKMQQVKRAALAPAQPSGPDRSVAARAGQIESQARLEKNVREEGDPSEENPAHGDVPVTAARRPYSEDAVGRTLDLSV